MPSVLLFNKPYGVISQFSSTGLHPTLKDYIPIPDFYPAGRLDTDSEGLLLLTDDGRLQRCISDPHHKWPKVYWAQVEGVPDEAALERLRSGVSLYGTRSGPAGARLIPEPAGLWARTPPIRFRRFIPTAWIELTLHEGKYRQVRRMTAALGFPTLRLVRRSVGPFTLEGLAPGAWRMAEYRETPARPSNRAGGRFPFRKG
jgi:23S rRNA pseudouridine2457 synthase